MRKALLTRDCFFVLVNAFLLLNMDAFTPKSHLKIKKKVLVYLRICCVQCFRAVNLLVPSLDIESQIMDSKRNDAFTIKQ